MMVMYTLNPNIGQRNKLRQIIEEDKGHKFNPEFYY